ncbi:hypothetical protein NA56DRAFT_755731 [Hyaloscypha hepaticicola]|uniref:Uncharacterized protein n=1 Tax=Hyaloscypha hepaticicola TaxID=2082293 RepID=A0A2J6PHD5_9HELO|nr:hypothetical protein NA56DRAFT_755731 [Hyaloscypha hepaticicola]
MAQNTMNAYLACLKPIIGDGDLASVFTNEATIMQMENPSLSVHDVIQNTISKLAAEQQITPQLQQRLELANQIAEISGQNAALVKAMDANSNVNSLRDVAVHYDTDAIQAAMGQDNGPSASQIRARLPNSGSAVE